MPNQKLFEKIDSEIRNQNTPISPTSEDQHSRILCHKKNYRRILINNIRFLFTCDDHDKLIFREHYSVIIQDGVIEAVLPADQIKTRNFDLIYDAGKRGGIVVTPGLVNTHAHIHMNLLRSAMMLDEEESVDASIAAMAVWQKNETPESYAYASLGDLTEQQKNGITTTLTHGPSFDTAEIAARLSQHNLVNAVSAVSHSQPENNPAMVEGILAQQEKYFSKPAIALHYLYKAPKKTLKEIKRIMNQYQALLTFHMAESTHVIEETLKKHALSETELLEKMGLLNEYSIASHVLHLKDSEIKKLSEAGVGIAHLPTSNTIHKSGTFQFWKFNDAGGFPKISLGTDSVVSKNRLDILTEAYQARITHLYAHTIRFSQLFKMMTVNGARVLRLPNRGKIMPGMQADLVFWKLRDRGFIPYDENDPITLVGNLITHGGRTVRDLMINGQFVIKDRRHQLINESQLLNILQEKHMAMRKRV